MSGKLTDIGGNPTGAIGRLAGRLMNGLSTRFYRSMIETRLRDLLSAGRRLTVLDIGCGGGAVVGVFHSLIPDGRVCGIDHSPDMAALSRRKNACKTIALVARCFSSFFPCAMMCSCTKAQRALGV